MDGRQSGCYAPEPGPPFPRGAKGGRVGFCFAGTRDPLSSEPQLAAKRDPARSRVWGWVVFLLALIPALTAIAIVPGFVTQDGPAHLYNAEIISKSREPGSPFRDVYQVRWEPFPNWTGHLLMVGLIRALPPREAHRLMTALTLVGFALAIFGLRWRVMGWRGMPAAALFSVLLALNVTWLFGFTSFLLGACLFPITLAVWWQGRDALGPGRIATLAALLTLGYFSHLVSLGLTVVSLVVLSLGASGERRVARVVRTAVALIPLVPLGAIYLGLSRRGGPMDPIWEHLVDPTSLASWVAQLGWADPVSVARKITFPFVEATSYGFVLLTPVLWLAIALITAGLATFFDPQSRGRRVWVALAGLLVFGGLVCPDTLGPSHGNYLPQRVVLFGLVVLVPFLDFEARPLAGRVSTAALLVAFAVQSGFIWEYALTSDRTAGAWYPPPQAIGARRKIATLLVQLSGSRFRANPLLHADNLLGVGTGNVVWNNYETRYYYFPVQFKPGIDRPPAADLEWVALHDEPRDAEKRVAVWKRLLESHHHAIDTLVVWKRDPTLDAINDLWFEPSPIYERGALRVFRHR